MMRRLPLLVVAWAALVAAAPAPVPVALPPPDLAPIVEIAGAALEKPAVPVPDLPPPAPPVALPSLPTPRFFLDPTIAKPVLSMRAVTCSVVASLLGSVSALIDCGRENYDNGKYLKAVQFFDEALAKGPDRDAARLARYWRGEALYRVNRIADADREFGQVATGGPRDELAAFARQSSGWTALQLGEPARALEAFDSVLSQPGAAAAPSLLVSSRRGRALALSLLGRWEDARQTWAKLIDSTPPSLAREAHFWLGECLGRLGQYGPAVEQLTRFAKEGAQHPLFSTAVLHLGWWLDRAGRPADAAKVLRGLLGSVGEAPERDLIEIGLVQALVDAGDWAGAQQAVKPLRERSSSFALATLFAMAGWVAARDAAAAHAFDQQLLARSLSPAERAWVLFVEGEVFRREGNRDEARTRYDLARQTDPASPLGGRASLRLAQLNFDFREFAQVQTDMALLLAQPVPGEVREPALLLSAESAYYGGDFDAAVKTFRRFLDEFRESPAVPAVTLSTGWAELRRGHDADARRIFTDFARDRPQDPLAADALELSAELAATQGDAADALALFGEMDARYPEHPRAELARLNQAIVLLRTGRAVDAQPLLRAFLNRSSGSPLAGRAHLALGVALLNVRLSAPALEEFAMARDAGEGPRARLGQGTANLARRQWDAAASAFAEARETGTAAVARLAEYGLAVIAFERGDRDGFRKIAGAIVRDGRATPALLYALTTTATDVAAWDDALGAAKQLATQFPTDGRADSALARVGAAAAAAKRWPAADAALGLLRQRYPASPFVGETLIAGAQAQIEIGHDAMARSTLEKFVTESPDDPRVPEAWLLLARVRDQAGDSAGALDAFAHAARGGHDASWPQATRLRYAHLLLDDKRWKEARIQLDVIVKGDDATTATEAAFYQGESYREEGKPAEAVEYFMTAAYLAPESPFGRQALLGAAASYVALKQPDSAAIAYNKLLAQADLPADIAKRAREGLAALGH
jgi:TolA-binding protein